MAQGEGFTRFRLEIAYDGTAFSGWAAQPGMRTVQGTLEEAIRMIARELSPGPLLTVAGRTDAGVHATRQVAHLDLDEAAMQKLIRGRPHDDPAHALVRRTNGILGRDSDAVLIGAEIAPDGFDARFSALSRSYLYRIADASTPANPLERHRTASFSGPLDVARMQHAADRLIGLHDFAGFCKPRPHSTTIRTLQRFDWSRTASGVVEARLEADAFCHSMVRSLVGLCAHVGAGRLALDRIPVLLGVGQRSNEFPVLSARGLTLTGVEYPAEHQLAGRQIVTRAQRPALRLVEPLTQEQVDIAPGTHLT